MLLTARGRQVVFCSLSLSLTYTYHCRMAPMCQCGFYIQATHARAHTHTHIWSLRKGGGGGETQNTQSAGWEGGSIHLAELSRTTHAHTQHTNANKSSVESAEAAFLLICVVLFQSEFIHLPPKVS